MNINLSNLNPALEGWFSKKPLTSAQIKYMSVVGRLNLIQKYWDGSDLKDKKVKIVSLSDMTKFVQAVKNFINDLRKIDTANPKSKETKESVKTKCEALLKKYKLDKLVSRMEVTDKYTSKVNSFTSFSIKSLAKESSLNDAGYKSFSDVTKLRKLVEELFDLGNLADDVREYPRNVAYILSMQVDSELEKEGVSRKQVDQVTAAWKVHVSYAGYVGAYLETDIVDVPWPIWPILNAIDSVILPNHATEAWDSDFNIALEAMESKPLKTPRTPNFKGTETTPWGDVDKTFDAFKKGYFKNTSAKKPEKDYTQFNECPDAMREWMSEHSMLGNPKGNTFREGVMLPVVNPSTGKLNAGGLLIANVYAGRVKGVSKETVEKTKEAIGKLYKEHFKKDVDTETTQLLNNAKVSKESFEEMYSELELVGKTINISSETIHEDDVDSKVYKQIKSECKLTEKPLVKFIKDFDKKNPGKLESWEFEYNFCDEDEEEDYGYYIINYRWWKGAWNDNQDLVHKLLLGIEDVVINVLKKKGWKLKLDKNKDRKLEKKFDDILVSIDLYIGDQDGNWIAPSTESLEISEEGIGSFVKGILKKLFGTDPNSPRGQKLLENRLPPLKEKLDNASKEQLNSKVSIPSISDMKEIESNMGKYVSQLDKIKVGSRDSELTPSDVEKAVDKAIKSSGLSNYIKKKGTANSATDYTDIKIEDLAKETTLSSSGYIDGKSIDTLLSIITKINEHGRKAKRMIEEPSRWDSEYAIEFEDSNDPNYDSWKKSAKATWVWVNALSPVSAFWEARGDVKPFLPIVLPLEKVLKGNK